MLIWGIGGGVATAAFRIAQALGARTIVTSSSDAKLARAAELGADAHRQPRRVATWSRRSRRQPAEGADVVVETVGEATWKRTLDAARPGGRVVVCGATSGPNPPAALHRLWWKQLDLLGSTMGTRADFDGAYDLVAAGATAGDRLGVPARRGPCRPRAPRVGRAVREDPALHPGLSKGRRGRASPGRKPGTMKGRRKHTCLGRLCGHSPTSTLQGGGPWGTRGSPTRRQPNPRMNFASSDIRSGVHGGSHVSSISTSSTPGTVRSDVVDVLLDHRARPGSPST